MLLPQSNNTKASIRGKSISTYTCAHMTYLNHLFISYDIYPTVEFITYLRLPHLAMIHLAIDSKMNDPNRSCEKSMFHQGRYVSYLDQGRQCLVTCQFNLNRSMQKQNNIIHPYKIQRNLGNSEAPIHQRRSYIDAQEYPAFSMKNNYTSSL